MGKRRGKHKNAGEKEEREWRKQGGNGDPTWNSVYRFQRPRKKKIEKGVSDATKTP